MFILMRKRNRIQGILQDEKSGGAGRVVLIPIPVSGMGGSSILEREYRRERGERRGERGVVSCTCAEGFLGGRRVGCRVG